MVLGLLVRQFVSRSGLPIQHSNVINRRFFRLVPQGQSLAVMRPERVLFTNVWGVRQIDSFAAIAGDSIDIPQLVPGCVLLVDDPFSVWGPGRAELAFVRLRQLQGPPSRGFTFQRLNRPDKSVVKVISLPSGDHAAPNDER